MNILTLALGLLLTMVGFVTLVRRVHDRTLHNAFAEVRFAHTDGAVTSFVAMLVPIVAQIASGIAVLVVAVERLGR